MTVLNQDVVASIPDVAGLAQAEPSLSDAPSEQGSPAEPPPTRSDAALAGQPASTNTRTTTVGSNRFEDVVSGQFDADEEREDLTPPKRVLAPMAESPKLHKVLAQSGMGSRLEMEQLIMEGRITVNNEPAHIGQRIQFGDHVKVNGKPIRFRIDPPPARVIAYHKPVGEVVSHDDPQSRPTVFRRLPKLYQGKWQSVGRLDINTEGLLLFTSSGELANNLMHPRFGLEREYAVRVLGALSKEERQTLLDGVKLDDGLARFGTIEEGGGEGSNCWYRVTISEGRNREVRRMFEAVGHAVSRLIRIRYGAMMLPRGLKRGAWMELDEGDIRALVKASGANGRTGPQGTAAEGERNAPSREDTGGGRRRGGRGRVGGPRGAGTGQRGAPSPKQGAGQPRNEQRPPKTDRQAEAGQPDPMKTAFGYIGADSFTRQRQGPAAGQRRSGGGNGGGGSGNGGKGQGGGGNRRGRGR